MVKMEEVYSDFTQTYGSCVLTSYAIGANYFTKKCTDNKCDPKPEDFFKAYCDHFKMVVPVKLNVNYDFLKNFCNNYNINLKDEKRLMATYNMYCSQICPVLTDRSLVSNNGNCSLSLDESAKNYELLNTIHLNVKGVAEDILGSTIIQECHSNSNHEPFKQCRDNFDLKFYSEGEIKNKLGEIEKILKSKEALLSIGTRVLNGVHCQIVGWDSGNNFYTVLTSPKRTSKYRKSDCIRNLFPAGTLLDALLLTRKEIIIKN